MSETATPQPSSDNVWPEPSTRPFSTDKAKDKIGQYADYLSLSAIDETPDLHDPYSDLSLFLSQKIKQEMQQHGGAKKWSMKIQEDLIKQITPDFQKKFPHYRLGIAALRKMWEKIFYYSSQIQGKEEAVAEDGKLNLPFFIRENLKPYMELKNPFHLQPYHYAHQLAMKVSECIATLDGVRLKLDDLTRMIWAIQRHMLSGIPRDKMVSPYDAYDKIDKLIVKTILEFTAQNPRMPQQELEQRVKDSLRCLWDLPSFATLEVAICEQLTGNETILHKLPDSMRQKIAQEIGNARIDNPHQTDANVAHLTVQFFHRIKELDLRKKWAEVERKVHNWTLQGDMLCRAITLDTDTPLFRLILEMWKAQSWFSHTEFVSEVFKTYLHQFPTLAVHTAQLSARIWTLYKYLWYTLPTDKEESSFDRFLKWHAVDCQQLEELCQQVLPLVPLNLSH